MRLLQIVLLTLSLSWGACAQTTISFTIPQNVATQDWVTGVVAYKMDSLKATIKPCPPVRPSLDSCKRNPTVFKIISATLTAVTFDFDAENVNAIDWSICGVNNNDDPEYGTISKLTSNRIILKYPTKHHLGSFVLSIKGSSCISPINSKYFAIK